MKLTDFDVHDDGDERGKACETQSSDSASAHDFSILFEEVENATGEFDVMISKLSTALRGAISENICYKPKE